MLRPHMGTFDYDTGTVTLWGGGSQVTDCTSIDSTALMLARIAPDRSVGTGRFAFAGDKTSSLNAANVIEAHTGRTFKRNSQGSDTDLLVAMSEAKDDPQTSVMPAHRLYMRNGKTALSDLEHGRYLDVKLESFAEFAARAPAPKAVV